MNSVNNKHVEYAKKHFRGDLKSALLLNAMKLLPTDYPISQALRNAQTNVLLNVVKNLKKDKSFYGEYYGKVKAFIKDRFVKYVPQTESLLDEIDDESEDIQIVETEKSIHNKVVDKDTSSSSKPSKSKITITSEEKKTTKIDANKKPSKPTKSKDETIITGHTDFINLMETIIDTEISESIVDIEGMDKKEKNDVMFTIEEALKQISEQLNIINDDIKKYPHLIEILKDSKSRIRELETSIKEFKTIVQESIDKENNDDMQIENDPQTKLNILKDNLDYLATLYNADIYGMGILDLEKGIRNKNFIPNNEFLETIEKILNEINKRLDEVEAIDVSVLPGVRINNSPSPFEAKNTITSEFKKIIKALNGIINAFKQNRVNEIREEKNKEIEKVEEKSDNELDKIIEKLEEYTKDEVKKTATISSIDSIIGSIKAELEKAKKRMDVLEKSSNDKYNDKIIDVKKYFDEDTGLVHQYYDLKDRLIKQEAKKTENTGISAVVDEKDDKTEHLKIVEESKVPEKPQIDYVNTLYSNLTIKEQADFPDVIKKTINSHVNKANSVYNGIINDLVRSGLYGSGPYSDRVLTDKIRRISKESYGELIKALSNYIEKIKNMLKMFKDDGYMSDFQNIFYRDIDPIATKLDKLLDYITGLKLIIEDESVNNTTENIFDIINSDNSQTTTKSQEPNQENVKVAEDCNIFNMAVEPIIKEANEYLRKQNLDRIELSKDVIPYANKFSIDNNYIIAETLYNLWKKFKDIKNFVDIITYISNDELYDDSNKYCQTAAKNVNLTEKIVTKLLNLYNYFSEYLAEKQNKFIGDIKDEIENKKYKIQSKPINETVVIDMKTGNTNTQFKDNNGFSQRPSVEPNGVIDQSNTKKMETISTTEIQSNINLNTTPINTNINTNTNSSQNNITFIDIDAQPQQQQQQENFINMNQVSSTDVANKLTGNNGHPGDNKGNNINLQTTNNKPIKKSSQEAKPRLAAGFRPEDQEYAPLIEGQQRNEKLREEKRKLITNRNRERQMLGVNYNILEEFRRVLPMAARSNYGSFEDWDIRLKGALIGFKDKEIPQLELNELIKLLQEHENKIDNEKRKPNLVELLAMYLATYYHVYVSESENEVIFPKHVKQLFRILWDSIIEETQK